MGVSRDKITQMFNLSICRTPHFRKDAANMINMTNAEYKKYVNRKSPNSHLITNMLRAFLVGGGICAIGQGISWLYSRFGLEKELVAAATPISLVFLSALLTGLHVYDNIALFGLAGTLVPITGFANAMVSPALEYKTEGPVLGVGGHMFSVAGPVLMFGAVASFAYGIIYMLIKGIH